MTTPNTPSSSSVSGGQWQNQSYGVNSVQQLYVSNQQINSTTGQPVPAQPATTLGGLGNQAGLTVIPVSQFNAYEIVIDLGVALVGGGAGQIMRVDVYFWDNLADNFPIEHIRWDCPSSSTPSGPGSGTTTWGHGPVSGNWMAVTLTDKTGLTGGMLGYMSMSGSTRIYTSHDWRSDSGLSSFTGSAATPYTNELCMVNALNIPASTTINRQIMLYSGRAFFHTGNAAAAGTINMQIVDDDQLEIVNLHPAQSNTADEEIIMPRKLCWLNIINTSGSAAGTANVALIADRF
jgi:hypothetical protein